MTHLAQIIAKMQNHQLPHYQADSGWEDDAEDLPLTYSFGYYSPRTNRKRFLGSPAPNNQIEKVLPKGDPENDNMLKLFVKVTDVHR